MTTNSNNMDIKGPTKYAVIIGINYTGTNHSLQGCINDANKMKQLLINTFGYPEANIKLLTDPKGGDSINLPTKANIISALTWLMSQPNSQLYLHYSGHGNHLTGNAKRADNEVEMICPVDFPTAGFLYDSNLRTLVNAVPVTSTLSGSMDCCYAEDNMDLYYNIEVNRDGTFHPYLIGDYTPTPATVVMMSSCQDNQEDADAAGANADGSNGALTTALCALWERNPKLSCADLLQQTYKYFMANNLSNQVPALSMGKAYNMNSLFPM